MRRVLFLFVLTGGLFTREAASRPRFEEFEVATIKSTDPEWKSAMTFDAKGLKLRPSPPGADASP